MPIKLPQTPMLTGGNEPFYPLTHASQVIKTDGSRLEQDGKINADTASTADKLGGKAPEYYIQPVNLLDNSDFTNPVNQRGQTSYDAPSGAPYNIDRWYANRATVTVDGDGITLIRNTSASNSSTYIGQKMADVSSIVGKTLTAVFMTSKGLMLGVFDSFADKNATVYSANGWEIAYSTSAKAFVLQTSTETNIKLYWAALYEGEYTVETLPPYRPKGYAAELAECQRYYWPIEKNSTEWNIGNIVNGYGLCIDISAAVNMRTTPTVEFGTPQMYDGTWFSITYSAVKKLAQGTRIIFVTPDAEKGKAYIVTGILALNADL